MLCRWSSVPYGWLYRYPDGVWTPSTGYGRADAIVEAKPPAPQPEKLHVTADGLEVLLDHGLDGVTLHVGSERVWLPVEAAGHLRLAFALAVEEGR